MADTLILVEDPVRKHLPVPPCLQMSVSEVVEIDILATQLFGDNTAIQDELLAIVGQGQLLAHMPLFPVAQDSSIIHLRSVSRETLTPSFVSKVSAARLSPKSA